MSHLLVRGSYFPASKNIKEILALSSCDGVIRLSIIVFLEVGFEPLAELEVVLILSLDELVYFDISLDAIFVKGVLELFVVLDIFILVLCVPPDLAKSEGSRVEAVHDSAVDGSGGALFDLLEL